MSDFEELARRRQSESEARLEKQTSAAAQKKLDAQRAADDALALLQERVVPVLEEAQVAFDKIGAAATIRKSWADASPSKDLFVTFYVGDVGGAGGIETPIGEVVKFSVRGGVLHVGGSLSRIDGLVVNEADERQEIVKAVDEALVTYYAAVERRAKRTP